MRTRNNIYFHEWIGTGAEVLESPNRLELGIAGTVIDETRKTVLIATENGPKRIAKEGRMFNIDAEGKTFRLNGTYSGFRPEDRIKERRRIEKKIRSGV